jgi:hypothetical protein
MKTHMMQKIYLILILMLFYSCKKEVDKNSVEDKNLITKNFDFKNAQGWWKLKNATYKPIRLINAGYANDITIHLNPDGNAEIFKDHNLDSLIDYHWRSTSKGISIGRLCIAGSNSPIYFLSKKKMIMSFDERKMDTLFFERCKPLK